MVVEVAGYLSGNHTLNIQVVDQVQSEQSFNG